MGRTHQYAISFHPAERQTDRGTINNEFFLSNNNNELRAGKKKTEKGCSSEKQTKGAFGSPPSRHSPPPRY
jgi:hypothetical protein